MQRIYITPFLVFLFLLGCTAIQKTFNEHEITLKKLSSDKFGSSFQMLYNNNKSYALVVNQEKHGVMSSTSAKQFFIFNMVKQIIIYEDNIADGKIKWKDNDQIEVIFTPGIISTEDENKIYGYIYNAKLKTKTDINSLTQSPND